VAATAGQVTPPVGNLHMPVGENLLNFASSGSNITLTAHVCYSLRNDSPGHEGNSVALTAYLPIDRIAFVE
jgi:hypothetical protein